MSYNSLSGGNNNDYSLGLKKATVAWTPMPDKLKDFRTFLTLVWRHLRLPDPTPVQLDIANYLQTGPKRKIIEGYRGVGKSWITSAYVVWKLRMSPNRKFMILSASKDRADNFSTFTLRLITDIPILQCLIPRPDQRCSKLSFDVAPARPDHAPSVVSKGIFSQITGGRADEIISDDIEVPNNSYTQMMRDKLSEAVKELDAILKPGGQITYLGTPQTEQSLYNILPERGYETRIWTARYPSLDTIDSTYGRQLAPFILNRINKTKLTQEGMPVDPDRFDDLDLTQREMSYGRSGFQLQFMLDTRLSDLDRYPLKLKDLIVMSCSPTDAPEKPVWAISNDLCHNDLPCVGLNGDRYYGPAFIKGDWISYQGAVMAVDPSGRGKDETAVVVIKMLNGFLYVTAVRAYQDGYGDSTLRSIAELAKEQNVNKVVIEANFGDGMFTKMISGWFAKIHRCSVEEVKHSKQKEMRIIDTLEPVMNQHRLVVDKAVIEWDYESTKHMSTEMAMKYQLFYQMSRITRDRGSLAHDDRLDCLAMAVAYWVEVMGQDVEKKMEMRKNELLRRELETWKGSVDGSGIAKRRVAFMEDGVGWGFDTLIMGGLEKAIHGGGGRGGRGNNNWLNSSLV